ncbi:hypothetical protein EVAR_46991_1 [Eumeta japonica]|uniref:Uncharacterized protein n=1 Tax=Eumeta variegata TaxID=151549 RepID=A0A4C1X5B1_EUMVA|nr:hypothetical protein EVAR_46991_1 [Eumeta japonica]
MVQTEGKISNNPFHARDAWRHLAPSATRAKVTPMRAPMLKFNPAAKALTCNYIYLPAPPFDCAVAVLSADTNFSSSHRKDSYTKEKKNSAFPSNLFRFNLSKLPHFSVERLSLCARSLREIADGAHRGSDPIP